MFGLTPKQFPQSVPCLFTARGLRRQLAWVQLAWRHLQSYVLYLTVHCGLHLKIQRASQMFYIWEDRPRTFKFCNVCQSSHQFSEHSPNILHVIFQVMENWKVVQWVDVKSTYSFSTFYTSGVPVHSAFTRCFKITEQECLLAVQQATWSHKTSFNLSAKRMQNLVLVIACITPNPEVMSKGAWRHWNKQKT